MIGRAASAALPVALAALATAGVAVLGARLRLLAPLAGFGLFAVAMIGGGGLALVLALVALRDAGPDASARGVSILAGSIGLGCVVFVGVLAAGASRAPMIHDITTDPDDPPAFVAAASNAAARGRDLSYPNGADETPRLQRSAYPDLEPIVLEMSAEDAFAGALVAAETLGWRVVARDEGATRFEAEDETAVFRFVDDVVVRVRPRDGGAVVDVRSTSRVGRGDMGVNAQRIRRFREALRTGRR